MTHTPISEQVNKINLTLLPSAWNAIFEDAIIVIHTMSVNERDESTTLKRIEPTDLIQYQKKWSEPRQLFEEVHTACLQVRRKRKVATAEKLVVYFWTFFFRRWRQLKTTRIPCNLLHFGFEPLFFNIASRSTVFFFFLQRTM